MHHVHLQGEVFSIDSVLTGRVEMKLLEFETVGWGVSQCIRYKHGLAKAYAFPPTTVSAPFPSITTSMVVPMFSNSAASTFGMVIARAPGVTRVVEVLVTSMGDCCLLTAQSPFSAERAAQLVLGGVSYEFRRRGIKHTGQQIQCIQIVQLRQP